MSKFVKLQTIDLDTIIVVNIEFISQIYISKRGCSVIVGEDELKITRKSADLLLKAIEVE